MFAVPKEFQGKLDSIPGLIGAFKGLTLGRQRGYLLYFSVAKQPKIREARVAKYLNQILSGKALEDD
jgi:uncharacterized protein YdeI (YjbR/CyaY-like superfamily)